MAWNEMPNRELARIRVLSLAILIALGFLGVVLWRVQVLGASRYRNSVDRQSVRRVRLPAARGRILDRNGFCLVDNRPRYCLALYLEELRQPGKWSRTVREVERVVDRLSLELKLKRAVTKEDIARHINQRLPLPFIAWRDLNDATLARWAERTTDFPGVDIYVEPIRSYRDGKLAAHVLGYVGRAEPDQNSQEPYHFYLPEMEGKFGVEAKLDGSLEGGAGGYLIRVDASGFKHGDPETLEPRQGGDVTLTLDRRIQQLAEQSLEGERGAVVVMDPRNGDILAMASSPSFDPNFFAGGIPREEWRRLKSDPEKPLLNRAISGTYAPGSVFKPIVVVAALESGKATENTTFECPGYFALGSARFHCWLRSGHGTLAMRKGIEQSCNAYFCQLGLACGIDRICDVAESVGIGQKTGIDLGAEAAGLMPSPAWKLKTNHDAWRGGDTCNTSIGQGAVAVTPLQIAILVSAIANGGVIYRPRLIYEGRTAGTVVRGPLWSPQTSRVVREGMRDVVQAPTGTGKRALIPGVEMGGKTGTAEYGVKAEHKKFTWMMVFAPYETPEYAVAMVVEDAVSGGVSVAPRIKILMEGVFRLPKEAESGGGIQG